MQGNDEIQLTIKSESSGLLADDTVEKIVSRLAIELQLQSELRPIVAIAQDNLAAEPFQSLISAAKQTGVVLEKATLNNVEDFFAFVGEGNPIVLICSNDSVFVLEKIAGRSIEATHISEHSSSVLLSRWKLRRILSRNRERHTFVAKKQLECNSLSSSNEHGDHHDHPTPYRRFVGLLSLDRRDIKLVFLFALVAGILALATPLAVESLVNVVSWGTYLQPLIVLGCMLLFCLGIAGFLRILQKVVVETIQCRQFVRIVSDLAHRFPRANQRSLEGKFPRELANRVFDIMTIQKATAVLLLDGVNIILTTALGMILLAFYHPFLLGFDIVLLISMVSITWALGRGGVQTAIAESVAKYEVVHWLQDVLASPSAFKLNGGETLAIHHADQLTARYINARKSQFRVVLRQVAFAISLQVLALTAVLTLGGWLVIDGQLTLGQLVASELVVTAVVGAFSKAGKSLEKFYDLMAGIDKVGHLLDIPADPIVVLGTLPSGPAAIRWDDLSFEGPATKSNVQAAAIEPAARVAVVGDDVAGRSLFAQALAGLVDPSHGFAEIAGFEAVHAACVGKGELVAYAGSAEVFHATLRENVDLGRRSVSHDRVREVLSQVGLAETVLKLPNGLDTKLQTGGYPLTELQSKQLMLARAMAASPKLLVVDGILDDLNSESRQATWRVLAAENAGWTLVVSTNRSDVADLCDTQIAIRVATPQ